MRVILEPWAVVADDITADDLPRVESLFAVSNGHVGWRATLDEGEPCATPGVYLNGFFEEHRMPYAEDGYGYPGSGQTVVEPINGTLLRITVGDDALDVRTGTVHEHRMRLDLRSGVATRTLDWTSPGGSRIRLTSTRLVSFARRSVGAIDLTLESADAHGGPVPVVVRSELLADDDQPDGQDEPAIAAALVDPLEPIEHDVVDGLLRLAARTRRSRLTTASACAHLIGGAAGAAGALALASSPRRAYATVAATLTGGRPLRLTKIVAAEFSGERGSEALLEDVSSAALSALSAGWDDLVAEQRAALDEHWHDASLDVEGAPDLQTAARFALFHLLQASVRAEGRIPAKGLTGRGYDGHAFWDTETFALPALSHLRPQAAAAALRWRHATLPAARDRAAHLGFAGAMFPWRTIDGRESSGYWPASSAAVHLGADIATAVTRYVAATGDTAFLEQTGLELLVETARFWVSFGHHARDGRFHLDGVTGPDEYSAIADDNVHTNLLAQRNLEQAAAQATALPDAAGRLGVTVDEIGEWRRAADRMSVPFDEELGVHPQSLGFTRHAPWDFESTSPEDYPMHSHFPYLDLYRKAVVKQADLVLALYLRHDAFTVEQKRRDFDHYEPLTVRDSSLSATSQAIVAAEVGYGTLALDYVRETALQDLADLHGNTSEGLHIAALGGLWLALVAGFGGLRQSPDELLFAPRLPPGISRLGFGMRIAGGLLRVSITPLEATYGLTGGEALTFRHHGSRVVLQPGATETHPIAPSAERSPAPSAPAHRSPREVLERSPVQIEIDTAAFEG
ncbi:glycosyl hydrolase family 65 protein [Herbiconiux sp.]|uniref:glycoside hydrolase family 65 protein n=1 Tax=Herbiconiux sp. TaxID=1871186 RepID=UPI0025C42772|nr:glycosyl hydrolase family 65 protein [Herbiconiux sp.]